MRDRQTDEAPVRGGPDSTLSSALADLEDGCSVLVTGDVPDDAYRVAASRYFGATDRRRRRVLALTTGSTDPSAWLPDGVDTDDDDTAVLTLGDGVRDPTVAVDATSTARGPDTTDTPNTPGGGDSSAAPDQVDLDGDSAALTVRTALLDVIEAVAPDEPEGRLELRVGVHRVDALSASIGAEATRDLLRDVATTTRDRGGMAHFHLPRAGGSEGRRDPVVDDLVEALGDDLDVVVELRTREDSPVPEERWHILGWGRSDWNPLR